MSHVIGCGVGYAFGTLHNTTRSYISLPYVKNELSFWFPKERGYNIIQEEGTKLSIQCAERQPGMREDNLTYPCIKYAINFEDGSMTFTDNRDEKNISKKKYRFISQDGLKSAVFDIVHKIDFYENGPS